MSAWLSDEMNTVAASEWTLPPTTSPRTEHLLRALDLLLAVLCLLPLLPFTPLLLAWRGRWRRTPLQGRGGQVFQQLSLDLPPTRTGRVLRALGLGTGLEHAPVLVNILRGEMAWVGPRARGVEEDCAAVSRRLRPGLVNPWFIRRRTAVDFGSELAADLHHLRQRSLRHDTGLLLRGLAVALLPPPGAPTVPGRVQVGDVAFDNIDMNEALARLREMLDEGVPQQVSFVNPACVNIAARHRSYRRVLARAALVLPDGIGIKIGTALLGTPLKQNVNGTDLFPRLCELLQARSAGVYLLGGAPGVAERVAVEITQRWPGVRIAGLRDGFFSVAEEGAVAAAVRESRTDLLLVARGVPAQDLFIDRYLPQLGVSVAMGVGGLFDFVSGRIRRAPMWMRESGLEWIYRLLQEPGRMWRRYLVGNLSFLARVALQRAGLRRPAADAQPLPRSAAAATSGGGVRAVIFATPRVASDLPLPDDHPTALLPLGCQTLVERLMAHLAQAAILDVDLVACDQPDALRALLGDGSRWGLRLHWHLMKDPAHPYAVLDRIALRGARRLLIGHADRCPPVATLLRLAQGEQWLVQAREGCAPAWSGWGSVAPQRLPATCAGLDATALDGLARQGSWALRLHGDDDGTALDSAAAVLLAQADAAEVPASWIRRPWGAMSPQARVDERATLVGPLRIGPGCIVERGAQLGPQVVLSRDVVVSAGTRLEHCLVLPGSYIGAGLTLSHAVVNGPRVRHLRWGVESRLAEADALMLELGPRPARQGSAAGRALAALALLAVGPALLAHCAGRRLRGRAADWARRPAVTGPVDGRPGRGVCCCAAPRPARGPRHAPGRARPGCWMFCKAGAPGSACARARPASGVRCGPNGSACCPGGRWACCTRRPGRTTRRCCPRLAPPPTCLRRCCRPRAVPRWCWARRRATDERPPLRFAVIGPCSRCRARSVRPGAAGTPQCHHTFARLPASNAGHALNRSVDHGLGRRAACLGGRRAPVRLAPGGGCGGAGGGRAAVPDGPAQRTPPRRGQPRLDGHRGRVAAAGDEHAVRLRPAVHRVAARHRPRVGLV